MEITGNIKFKTNSLEDIGYDESEKSVMVCFNNEGDEFFLYFNRKCFETLIRLGVLFLMDESKRAENPEVIPGKVIPNLTLWMSRDPVSFEVEGLEESEGDPPLFHVLSRNGRDGGVCLDFSVAQAKVLRDHFQKYIEFRQSMKDLGKKKMIPAEGVI